MLSSVLHKLYVCLLVPVDAPL